ncbi:MAG TPA: D-alanyl-D-alanine carboxypeptidase/D-alanyl-D-alanine-endopeptidase [Fibrobacteria bacterium]|nr:D-alanyl-D-alanine carboxypeptidase/D-alanyl-D-alanine-endopeptidase [Fibrobacteria bacterium]
MHFSGMPEAESETLENGDRVDRARKATLLAFCAALLAGYPSAKEVPPKPPAKEGASLSSAFPREAMVGWALLDPAAPDVLVDARQAEVNFTPGSTQKLFTTWIALEKLGGDKTYVTELFRTGTLEGERLKGDLLIRGGGDPSFAGSQFGPDHGMEAVFAQWLLALRKQGIRKVDGCVIGDGTFLEEDGPHPAGSWEDAGNYYAGTVSGLSFNDNLYAAFFNGAASPGKPVVLKTTLPVHTGIARFDNRLVTGPADGHDSAFILGGFPSPVRILRGTYPAGRMPFSIKGSLPNPPWTCAREFRAYLAAKGIAFSTPDGAECGDSLAFPNHAPMTGAIAVPGARHVSPPLRELLRIVNQKSDNNYAAQTLALLGKGTGRSGDWRGGLAAVHEYLDGHGFDRKLVHLKDGNGLSRYNWIAPAQTVKLLGYAFRQKNFPEFQATLPGAPGAQGRLERYGAGWEGRLYAKTGTLEGVSALAGYLKTASGKWLAFSIAVNNFESGNGDAQKFFAPLLRKWAAKY